MITDISNRLARFLANKDFDALANDEECRRALGLLLLEKDRKGQGIGHCDVVAKYARFPTASQRLVALMIVKWSGADWGTPHLWTERFY